MHQTRKSIRNLTQTYPASGSGKGLFYGKSIRTREKSLAGLGFPFWEDGQLFFGNSARNTYYTYILTIHTYSDQ